MNSIWLRNTFALLAPLTALSARAQGGCPPGMIPYRGNDLSSCGPIPQGYYRNQENEVQAQQLPPEWISRWGAIATDAKKGALGTASGRSSESAAESLALSECHLNGGESCKIDLSYSNGCAAMMLGDKVFNSNAGVTVQEAIQKGLTMCAEGGDTTCHVYYSGCSLPARIR